MNNHQLAGLIFGCSAFCATLAILILVIMLVDRVKR
jgi:hypothetical protein